MIFDTPPRMSDQTVYQYLFRLSEALNLAMEQLDRTIDTKAQDAVQVISAKNGASDSSQELKALIVSTASIIRKEMDTYQTELHGQYEAISEEFGSYQESLDATITATADGILQEYGFASRLDALDSKAAGFEQYRTKTEGFIKQGFIEYDDNGAPVIGIAIGQNLKSTTVSVDGQTLEQLDSAQSCAFYTSEKVSFRIGGNEVAYVSNRKLYILDAEITGSLTVGGWLLSNGSAGLTLRYIGG